MTIVLVHGNPETAAIWELLIAELGRDDIVTLSPPGFGAPVPTGFGATRVEYVDWLVAELELLGAGPVDLVGHDWGGGHVMGVAMTRPDLIRSWCVDVAGIFHPDYEWHDAAQLWQTPDVGEQTVAAMLAPSVDERAEGLAGLGMTPDAARAVAEGMDAAMGDCILKLYRDAAQPALRELASSLPYAATRPGLVIVAEHDHYVGTEEMARQSAAQAGASVTVLSDVGHWWMMQDPTAGAAALTSFWSGLD
ncbi:MAG: alpha/beta fold hydrolase [Actinomycetota bacterium]